MVERRQGTETFFWTAQRNPFIFEEQLTDSTDTFQAQLQSPEFLCDLAFLTDMTNHLNVSNLSLQGKRHSISNLVGHVESFRSKLVLFTDCLQSSDLAHFPAALSS